MSEPRLARRGLLAALSAAAVGTALAGCGSEEKASVSGSWSFTDDLGQKLTADRTPVRIAAYGDAAAALWHFGIVPVAVFHYGDPADDPTFEGLDLSKTKVVGTAYGEIELEQLAATRPDLVVTTTYDGDTPAKMYGFKDAAQITKIRGIAPIAGIEQKGSALDVIERNEELVASLGVDVDGGKVAADRAAFQQASAALTAAAKNGLTVAPVYAEDANLYFAKAPDDPALRYYADLGLSFVPIGGSEYYWEVVSWEKADTYQADVVLYSMRDSYTPDQLRAQPTFARTPAVRANQLHPWKFTAMAYPAQTAYLEEITGWLGTDRKVTYHSNFIQFQTQ